MPQNFIEDRREQGFLLPPDVREWLPADHLAWFVIDAVAEMDLSAFYAAYRADGHGRAAYEPSLMVALVLYAFATRVRSSRAIERHCRQDVAYRVITGNLVPDHATVARFVCRHEQALADLFGDVLKLCDRAGLVKPGVVSIDGTRIAGNAGPEVNRTFDQIACEVLAEVRATDEAEDEAFGEARGDELPEQPRTEEGRREFFRQARQQTRREQERPEPGGEPAAEAVDEVSLELEANNIGGRGGRDAWLREGKRQLEQHRWENPDSIPRGRPGRLLMAAERLQSDHDVECRCNAAYVQSESAAAADDTTAMSRRGSARRGDVAVRSRHLHRRLLAARPDPLPASVDLDLAHVDGRAGAGSLGRVHGPEGLVALAHVGGAVEELEHDGRALGLVEQRLHAGGGHAGRRPLVLVDPTDQLLHPLGRHIGEPDHAYVQGRLLRSVCREPIATRRTGGGDARPRPTRSSRLKRTMTSAIDRSAMWSWPRRLRARSWMRTSRAPDSCSTMRAARLAKELGATITAWIAPGSRRATRPSDF